MANNVKKRLVIKKQTKVTLYILGIFILISAIILASNLLNNNNYSVNYGETLKVQELDGYYNFELDVLSVIPHHIVNNINDEPVECLTLKVRVKNLSTETFVHHLYTKFTLLDSNDKEIATADSLGMLNESLENIPSGHETIAYLYFYKQDKDKNWIIFNKEDIAKLKVEVLKNIKNNQSPVSGDYRKYYINF